MSRAQLILRLRGGINYSDLVDISDIPHKDSVDVSVIIPVRNRVEFHQVLVDHIKRSFQNSGKTFVITFVEHSATTEHQALAAKNGCNYLYIPSGGIFNKCLAFNTGFLFSVKSKHYLLHDIDCMMQTNFVDSLYKNLHNYGGTALQTFTKKRVLYCNEHLSSNIINGSVSLDSLSLDGLFDPISDPVCGDIKLYHNGVTLIAERDWQAPGGSIFCSYEQFIAVGGFDPEYFSGYSIEDGFFYSKLMFTCGVNSCNDPEIELFHLHHPPATRHNIEVHTEQHQTYDYWTALHNAEKHELLDIKSNHLKKFLC